MKTKSKKELELQKQRYELGLKYAKSTFIRYMTAVMFVVSVYWLFLGYTQKNITILLPILYLLGSILASIDQYNTIHNNKKNKFIWTRNIFKIEIISNLILTVISIYNYKIIFPYFSRVSVPLFILIVSILLKIIIINKINRINKKGE